MSNPLVERVRHNRYARGMRRNLRRQKASGEITTVQFENAYHRTYNPDVVAHVIRAARVDSDMLGEFSWENLLNWLWEHRAEIFKFIMSFVVLLLDEDKA